MDGRVDPPEAVAHHRPDRRVGAGREAVQQHGDQFPLGEQAVVRLPEARQIGLHRGGVAEGLLDAAGGVLHRREEQLLLGAEKPDHVRLGDAGQPRHLIGRGARVAAGRESGHSGGHELPVALVGGESGSGHG